MLRSLLVPADSRRKVAKARETEADAVVLDWEDAVADGAKADARLYTVEALRAGLSGVQLMLVRISRVGCGNFREDCRALGERLPGGIMLRNAGRRRMFMSSRNS